METNEKKVLEVPPKVRAFIDTVIGTPFESIDVPLKIFSWEYEKGDFYHWVDIFSHFNLFFEKYVKPRRDFLLEGNLMEDDAHFPREAVIHVLRVTQIILENCVNKQFCISYEQHISSLLASTDADVIVASLQTLAAFLKKPMEKCSPRDASINAKLFALLQGWGTKEEGLGLIDCSLENFCDPVAYEVGCNLHFEFYINECIPKEDIGNDELQTAGLQVIHLPDVISHSESDLQLLKHLVHRYNVPPALRFSLFTRVRYARAFPCLVTRRQFVSVRLYAFIVLAQSSSDGDDLAAFFVNEPEFVSELVTLLSYEDIVPEDICILAIQALTALYQEQSHRMTVLNAIMSGRYHDTLTCLMQKEVGSITSGTANSSTALVQALLSLVTVIVSSSAGCSALWEAGFVPTLLPFLNELDPQRIHLASTAVHILEAFMDYNSSAATLFRDLGGLDDAIARVKLEVSFVEAVPRKPEEELKLYGKENSSINSAGHIEKVHSHPLVSYQRRLLMKALLRVISLGISAPGSTAHFYGSHESTLPFCLCTIFRRARDFGGGIFSLASTLMSNLIHKDPTCFSVLNAAGIPNAFLDSIIAGVLSSAEAVTCIPQCLDSLCLNDLGIEAIKDRNALQCFVNIFTSRSYLQALKGDTPGSISSGIVALLRHAASLQVAGVDMLIEILNIISKMGCSTEASAFFLESGGSFALVPMEIDLEERTATSVGEGGSSTQETSEQAVEVTVENSSSNIDVFLPECISNAAQLLENVLQNSDICKVFIEKMGIEAILHLCSLPLFPLSFSIGQNISVAFKNFSPQHSSALTSTVCSYLKKKLEMAIVLLESVAGTKLSNVEGLNRLNILRCMSVLESILSLSTFLLKNTTTMMPDLGSANGEIINDVGQIYKEVLWQLSLINDAKVDPEKEVEGGDTRGLYTTSNIQSRESDNDTNTVLARNVNHVSIRNGLTSHSGVGPEHLLNIHPGEPLQYCSPRNYEEEGRRRRHLVHIERDAEVSPIDIGSPKSSGKTFQICETKQHFPDLDYEILNRFACSLHSFLTTLAKGLIAPNRRRIDIGMFSITAKSLAAALAKVYHGSLSFNGHSNVSGLESSLSAKCRYLGKVVDGMAAIIYDNRRHVCNTAMVTNFHAYGTIKELLISFKATSELLGTLPQVSLLIMETEHVKQREYDKLEHSSWLLETLQSYCRFLEHLVNSSMLLSRSSVLQLLAETVSGGSCSAPRDPEAFVHMLQAQVLDAVLHLWNHSLFPYCSTTLITSVITIINHIYSGIGDVKSRKGGPVSANQRFMAPPPDESAISLIVEMGFSRERAQEVLRHVESNSVEMAMEWLFSHPEVPGQESDDLARAVALSLDSSVEPPQDDTSETEAQSEVIVPEAPPVEFILATSMKLLQSTDLLAFPLTDLIVTLCNQNRGQDCLRVLSYLIQKLKLFKLDSPEIESGPISTISHILALVLAEDGSEKKIAADNGIVSITLDILMNFNTTNTAGGIILVPKWVTALLLVLDHMLQCNPLISPDGPDAAGTGANSHVNASEDATSSTTVSAKEDKIMNLDTCKQDKNPFAGIVENKLGFMTIEEHQKAFDIACNFIQHHVPATTMQAVLQLCVGLTKSHLIAIQFLERGILINLLSLPRGCLFPGFDNVLAAIIHHLLEDPQTLQVAMQVEIQQSLMSLINQHDGSVTPRQFLTSMAPVISRDPSIFIRAATSVCQLESIGGSLNIILKEKERDKDKGREKENAKDRNKTEAIEQVENGIPPVDYVQVHEELGRMHDGSVKYTKGHKKVPCSFTQVIYHLLEIILHHPLVSRHETCTGPTVCMEVDEGASKDKGKSKVDEIMKPTGDGVSESSTELAKMTFVLKLMSDILLMYIHAAGVVLQYDSESRLRCGPCHPETDLIGHNGLLFHVLHVLLPCNLDTLKENDYQWREKLSEKASWFLVVLCCRSREGRKRVVGEIVRALSADANSEKINLNHVRLPNRKLLSFVDLVTSLLSKHLPGNMTAPGYFPDMAKTMIDAGMVQALTSTLQVIDLDHPEVPKLVNLILKSLEVLTRAANSGQQVYKTEGSNKQKSLAAVERTQDQTSLPYNGEESQPGCGQNTERVEQQMTFLAQNEGHSTEVTSETTRGQEENQNGGMEHDVATAMDRNVEAHPVVEHGLFMHAVEEAAIMHGSDAIEMTFLVGQKEYDGTAAEDEEGDRGDDGEDNVEEVNQDDDGDEEDGGEEGAAPISLSDTAMEDHEDNVPRDEYVDDIVEEMDENFHENHVLEVRWREGLDRLDQLQLLRLIGGGNFIEISAEHFQGIHVNDYFGLNRSVAVDHHRQRPMVEQSGLNLGGSFQHPLLTRPSLSNNPSQLTWAVSGSMSREANAVSVGSFNVGHFYMSDAPIQPPEQARAFPFGDHRVGGSLSSHEFRVSPLYSIRRRALGDGRWTDNGRAQAGDQAAVVAQAVEEQFIHQLCNLTEVNDHRGQGLVDSTNHHDERLQITIPLGDADSQSILTVNSISEQQYRESQVTEVTAAVTQETENIEGNRSGFAEFIIQNRVEVDAALAEEGGEPLLRSSDLGCQDGVGIVSIIGQSSCGLGVETGSANRHPEIELNPIAQMPATPGAHDLVYGCQESQANGTLTVESLDSFGVESRSADGFPETERQPVILSVGASNVGVSDTAPGKRNEAGALNLDEEIERTVLDNEDEEAAADPNHTSNEAPPQQVEGFVDIGIEGEQVDRNNGDSDANAIDSTFLEAIPEDLRAEVLASQHAQPVPAANYGPPAEEIDPEFLAALPPDIQAEVLAQQHSLRVLQAHEAEGQGVDMDNASFIATLPADLREEVLLTSPEEVLAALPSPLLAEAQMLRDRARSHYQDHSLFGEDHRPRGRENGMVYNGQPEIDRGTVDSVGLSLQSKLSSSLINSVEVKEVEGKSLVDTVALKSLLQLLRLAQPLDKELLQKLLLNLCGHSATQTCLIQLLLDMVRPETVVLREYSDEATSQRLYGCQWNVVYTRSRLSNGFPPLLSRRVLEILTYLATNRLSVANLLVYMEPCSTLESSCRTTLELKKAKGKEKLLDKKCISWSLDGSQKGEISLAVLLKLLNEPLVLRSSSHLEQVMDLLNVVLKNVELKDESHSSYGEDVLNMGKETQAMPEMVSNVALNTERDECSTTRPETEIHKSDVETKTNGVSEASISGVNKATHPHDIFLHLSEPELQNVCKLLAKEGLSDKVYSLAAEILKKLACMTSLHSKHLISELVKLAGGLSDAAMCELMTLANTEMLGLSSHSMAGEAILRILKALITLVSGVSDGLDSHKTQRHDREQEGTVIFRELNKSLEPLWQALSVCIGKTETKLGNISTPFVTTSNRNSALDIIEATAAMSPPLPPGSQRLLPFIEAFFILCEKIHLGSSIMHMDNCDVTAREIKEAAACTSFSCAKSAASPQKKEEGSAIFVRFAEKHRRFLNALIRQNPGLLEKSLSLMLRASRLIDFDNKKGYFRSRIREQHMHVPSAPLRLCVRRAYLLEDSYNQLRMRSNQDLNGHLSVHFQGEEGIDAGGLTREWYQLLSRVIFDKGALLFTTVGNESTFQPNPNSVIQTEHLSYFKFVGRVVAKALLDGQLLDVYFTRSFYKHILGVKVTYHDIEAIDPGYYKNLKWMLENDISDFLDLTFTIDADEEKHILYEKTEVTDCELIPGGRNVRVTEENKHEYVDLVAEHRLTTAIRPQINAFMESFNGLVPKELISIFNDKELELLISGLPEIDFEDLKANTEYNGYTSASPVVQWFWEVVQSFSKEDMARLLQFITGTSKVPLEGFKALQGISGTQRFQIHKAYGSRERLPSAHTCFNQLDLPDYSSKEQLQERLLLAIHEANEGFGFG